MRGRGSIVAIWLLLAATIGVVAGAAPASAEPTIGLTGPAEAEPGAIVELVVTGPAEAVAVEAAITYDREALEFGGLYFADESTRVLTATNRDGGIDVGGYHCGLAGCDRPAAPVGSMTLRFTVNAAGDHTIRLARGLAVASDGAVLVGGAEASLTLAVSGDGADTGGSTLPALADARSAIEASAADVTRDERVDQADVVDIGLGWAEARHQGDPCIDGVPRLDRLDVDGSGCIDVADLVAVAVVAAAQPVSARAVAPPVDRPPMVVNSTSDEWDRQLSNEICDTASGVCSLRAALHQANWNPGPDTIHFDIPGSGPHRITLGEQLYITDTSGGVTIDGFTQPGASPNSDPYLSNASIRIELLGQGYGRGTNGIVITSADNEIRGLAIYRAFSNIRLTGPNVTGNRLVGNHIGTNANATHEYRVADVRDQAGVEIVDGASYNIIGTPALADRNVISGNPYSGVRINHAATTGNIVQNNLVGLTPSGNDSLYSYVAGIDVQWGAKESWIGGYQEHAGNVVTGNSNYGIDLSHSSKNNIVVGNRLGTNATGTRVLSHSPNLIGLAIKDDSVGNTVEYNVMGGNSWHGIWHRHNFTGPNTFRSNWIGIGLDGSNIGNDRDGVYVSGHDDTYEANLIAYNGDEGVSIQNYNGGNGFAPPQYTERNRITANAIFDNSQLGIDILSGHNGISRPRITSASTGTARGTACGGCTVELYLADGGEGRRYVTSTTASGGGSWTIDDGRIRDADLVALGISSSGDTSEFSGQVRVGSVGGNSTSSLAGIGDRTVGEGQWDEVTPSVGNPDGDHLVFHAYGLPRGMSVDRTTGRMYGRPSTSGVHRVILTVDDGGSLVQTTFRWNVVSGNAQAAIGDRVTYLDGSAAAGVGIDLFSEGRGSYLASTSTDASGTYRFDVAPACYVVTFLAPGGAQFDTGAYKNVDVCLDPAEVDNSIDAVLIPDGGGSTAVGGRVVDEAGAAASGVSVDLFSTAADGSRDTYLRSAATGGDGTYRFDLTQGGCYVMVLVAPNGRTFRSGSPWAERATCVAQGAEDLSQDATLAGGQDPGNQGTISGTVTTAGGGTPPTTGVDLFAASADGSRGAWLRSTGTDGSGDYGFSAAPGCYVLVFIAPNGFAFPGGSIYSQAGACTSAGQTTTVNRQLG